MKKVRDYMRSDVFFVRPNFTVFEVARVLSKNNIGGAPVVNRGAVIGMISITDITRFMSIHMSHSDMFAHDPNSLSIMLLTLMKMGKDFADFRKELDRMSKYQVKDMMTRDVVAISPDAQIFEAAAMMEKHDVNRLPVINSNKLVGIITRADLLRALIE